MTKIAALATVCRVLLDPILPDGTVVRHPLPRSVVALAAVVAGFLAARFWQLPSTLWLGVGCGICVVGAMSRGVPCRVALILAMACLGAGCFAVRLIELDRDSLLLRMDGAVPSLVVVEGVVLDTPRELEVAPDPMGLPLLNGARMRLPLRIDAVVSERGREKATGRVWVRAEGGRREGLSGGPLAGDRIRVTGLFTPTPAPMNPGEFDRRLWSRQAGFIGSLRIGRLDEARQIGSDGTVADLESTWLRAKAWMADRTRVLLLGESTSELDDGAAEGRALLGALILGEEDQALREARGAFNRLGLAHVLSISGFHIAVMTAVGLLLLRAAGDLGWVEPVLIAALVMAYLVILPFNAPVWRSGLMVLGLLLGDALGRRYDRLALLGWIAVLLLLWRPMDAWSMGFQLSFGLVAVLLWLGSAFHVRLWGMRLRGQTPKPPRIVSHAVEPLKKLVSTNLLCCAAATPIVLYHTGLVSPLSVALGVVVIPLITIVLIAGYAAIGIGVLIPPMTEVASGAVASLAGWTGWLVRRIDELPWSLLRSPNVSLAWAVAATALVLYWLARGYWRDRAAWIATLAVALWFGAEAWLGPRLPRGVELRIDTLAVGDGTCHLVRSGREALIWDCGSLTPGVGRGLVPRAVRELGAWRAPIVVVTHPNIDHFNGIPDVIEPLGVRRVLVGEAFVKSAAARPYSPEAYLLANLRGRGVEVTTISAGATLRLGEATFTFVSPPAGAAWGEANDMSLVAVVSTPGKADAAIFCGDIQDRAIESLSSRRISAAIMEAPHHGSARASAIGLVVRADPEVVLQSTGPGRAGDPRWAAERNARDWWCTATDGACRAEVLRDGTVRSGASR